MSEAILRRRTRKIRVGSVEVGGDAPVTVQSMTKTDTKNVGDTLKQIRSLEDAGCEIIRISVPDEEALSAFKLYLKEARVPLVADIHFNYRLAVSCLMAGAACVRVNPGNIGGADRLLEVVKAAEDTGAAIRIGVNSGSLEKRLLEKHGGPTAQALAESALYWSYFLEDKGFLNFKVSIKSSSVLDTYRAHLIFSERCEAPIHLGITEAGFGVPAVVKSSVGIGSLLLRGIGDTIRVSLTADPVEEVRVGFHILQAVGLRRVYPEVISCPTCSRKRIDVIKWAEIVQRRLENVRKPVKVAVMGCEVNGPGEAREADCGIAGGRDFSLLFKKGKVLKKVRNEEAIEALLEVIKDMEVEDAG